MDGSLRYRRLQQWDNTRRVRRIRHLQERFNPLEEYDNANFRLLFHLGKDSVIKLTAIEKNELEHPKRRGLPLTPIQQVLLTLRFYVTASFPQVIGVLFGVSNYAVCNEVVHRVSRNMKDSSFYFQPISMRRREAFNIAWSYFLEWVCRVNNCKFYQSFHKT